MSATGCSVHMHRQISMETNRLALVAQCNNRPVDGRLTLSTIPKRHNLDQIIPFHHTSLYFNETAFPLLTYTTQRLSLVDTFPVLETVCFYKGWPHVSSPLTVGRCDASQRMRHCFGWQNIRHIFADLGENGA